MKKTKPTARDHYEREKARRATNARPESEVMAAARREYEAMLAAQATKGKGGRPKKKVAKPAPKADELFDELEDTAPDEEPEADAEEE